MSRAWIPQQGEVIWIDFDPQAGHEQAGHRPALVLSKQVFNKSGLAIVCPVTSQVKGHPFEVPLQRASTIAGVVLSDHIKSLDWRARKAKLAEPADPEVVDRVLQFLKLIFAIE